MHACMFVCASFTFEIISVNSRYVMSLRAGISFAAKTTCKGKSFSFFLSANFSREVNENEEEEKWIQPPEKFSVEQCIHYRGG